MFSSSKHSGKTTINSELLKSVFFLQSRLAAAAAVEKRKRESLAVRMRRRQGGILLASF